jgi:predicted amidohydrolase YtcJ
MCTYNGCYTTFDEKERGSLEEGKIADMVILSGNPYTVGNENLKDLKVEKLILAGRDYESCRSGVLGSVLKGLFSRSKAY